MRRWRMRTGRPTAEVVVTGEEREALERWARRPKTAQALAQRARIVLACATGATNTVVAARFRITRQMVGKWRARFVGRRLDGLLDEPRPGAPRRGRGEGLGSGPDLPPGTDAPGADHSGAPG